MGPGFTVLVHCSYFTLIAADRTASSRIEAQSERECIHAHM